jgi:large subunit ribosomal protein L2
MSAYLKDPSLFLIYKIKRLSKVSLLELFPGSGIQYARSSGSYAKLIKLDLPAHVATIQLPSGVKKVFSIYSLVSLGSVSLKIKKKITNTKSGFYRVFGKKSMVRGVARNPVDHPHGGRTKSIKYPRTPWGKTTKFK